MKYNAIRAVKGGASTASIIDEDTQAIGEQVQARIEALDLPPGVEVRTGGIFEQIARVRRRVPGHGHRRNTGLLV